MTDSCIPNIDDLDSKLNYISFKAGTTHRIDITFVENPESFYVRPVQCREIMPVLEAPGEKQRDDIKVGDTIVYKSNKLKKFIRGCIIVATNKQYFNILAIDYGFSENSVAFSNIAEPKNVCNRRFIQHCSLICTPAQAKWTYENISFFKELVVVRPIQMNIVSETPTKLNVELTNSCGIISDTLIMTGHAYFRSEVVYNEKENNCFKYLEPYIGEKINVFLLWIDKVCKTFYVKFANNLPELYQLQTAHISTIFDKLKFVFPKDIKKGMVVATKGKGKVQRGIVKKVSGDKKVLVHLVDSGYKSEFLITNIRYLPVEFLKLPAMALFCNVLDSESWHKIVGKSSYHLESHSFNITIIKSGKDHSLPYTVELNR